MSEVAELDIAILVARAFESLGLRYLIAGSLASSIHGLPRSSNDADLLAAWVRTSPEAVVATTRSGLP